MRSRHWLRLEDAPACAAYVRYGHMARLYDRRPLAEPSPAKPSDSTLQDWPAVHGCNAVRRVHGSSHAPAIGWPSPVASTSGFWRPAHRPAIVASPAVPGEAASLAAGRSMLHESGACRTEPASSPETPAAWHGGPHRLVDRVARQTADQPTGRVPANPRRARS